MIVIKVEMWPKGNRERAYEFARAVIANDGVQTLATQGKRGGYAVWLWGGIWNRPNTSRVWKQGVVREFDRERLGVWDLIYQALRNILGERSK